MSILIWIVFGILALAVVVLVVRMRRGAPPAVEAPELRRLAAELALAEERRAGAFRHLRVPALRLDPDGRVAELTHVARERFPQLDADGDLLSLFGSHELANLARRAIEEGRPRQADLRLFADGRRTFRASVDPYPTSAGVEALVTLEDLSDERTYQELRSQFVANVSHELRTPLTGLRGLVEALADLDLDPARRAEFAERAAGEARRLEAIVADVLFLSELEAATGPPEAGGADMAEALVEAAEDVRELAQEQNVRLVIQADAAAPTSLTERLAHIVARNLLENAARYAGPGATATASVSCDDGIVTLTVADDGVGIPERHLPHIFERFYRADPGRSRQMGGTGLGLSIVKHIAELLGGGVEASSRPGFGTTVSVRVPADRAAGRW